MEHKGQLDAMIESLNEDVANRDMVISAMTDKLTEIASQIEELLEEKTKANISFSGSFYSLIYLFTCWSSYLFCRPTETGRSPAPSSIAPS